MGLGSALPATALSIVAIILALVCLALVAEERFQAPAPISPANDERAFKVIIAAGQSNTVGRAPILPEWQVDTPGIYQLGRFGDTNWNVIPATEPLANWDPSGAAFVLPAVRLMHDAEPGDYLIVPVAMGGSGFVDNMWIAPNGPLYRDMITRVRYVLERYPRARVEAVFWLQGESEWIEAPDGYNEAFPEQMAAMVSSLRYDLDLAEVPFLMSGAVPSFAETLTPNINEVLPKIAADIGACFVPVEGLLPMADGIHMELGSMHVLGRRYFEALKTCRPRP